jgi:CHAD domain-containing protein
VAKPPNVALAPDTPSDEAAAEIALALLDTIRANLPGALDDRDPECLHDFRVSVRRTRSLQRELKKVFPPDDLKRFRKEFRRLQRVTGPTRDLDVYLLEFDLEGDLKVLRALLDENRVAERTRMEKKLRAPRVAEVLSGWKRLLEDLPSLPVGDRPAAARPIGDLAARRIHRVYGQMVEMGSAIDDSSPHSALHDLRKKGKELRYLLEFFSSLFPREVIKPMVQTLKSLQDTLGRFQDREVQAAMISDLRPKAAKREPGAVEAIDSLVERLHAQQDEARAEFSVRFAAFAASEQRDVVAATFDPA